MQVRAKFRVESITPDALNPDVTTVNLRPVYSSDPTSENAQFWRWTPSGYIQLGTVNRCAVEAFEYGKEFYVDFTPAVS